MGQEIYTFGPAMPTLAAAVTPAVGALRISRLYVGEDLFQNIGSTPPGRSALSS